MIVGLGVDLCSIPRMAKAVSSEHFVRRIFRPAEIAYADGKENERSRASSYASAFAAREAYAKASGISMYRVALASAICLDRSATPPRLLIPAELDPLLAAGAGKRVLVSLSHDGDYAVAVVVIEVD